MRCSTKPAATKNNSNSKSHRRKTENDLGCLVTKPAVDLEWWLGAGVLLGLGKARRFVMAAGA